MKSDAELLKDIGDRIKSIPENKTLKDLVKHYGEDYPGGCLPLIHLTWYEQKALGLVGGEK